MCAPAFLEESRSVWYSLTNDSGSEVEIFLKTDDSDYDTLLQVFTGTCQTPVSEVCNDDVSFFDLTSRVNFVAEMLGDASKPGVQSIINRLGSKDALSPEEVVDGCLELLGAIRVEDGTRQQLVDHVKAGGGVKRGSSEEEVRAFGKRVTEVLQLIAATREYQFA